LDASGEAIDTTTPSGKLMFSIVGAFAEFERSMIQVRIKAGLDRAKANGVKLGRPRTSDAVVRQSQRV
jgi:DNA invertase Pin-like site-specific DNA recombinase